MGAIRFVMSQKMLSGGEKYGINSGQDYFGAEKGITKSYRIFTLKRVSMEKSIDTLQYFF